MRSPGFASGASAGSARTLPFPAAPTRCSRKDAVCLLDVPTHETGTALTKPVDPILGRGIEAWQALRQ